MLHVDYRFYNNDHLGRRWKPLHENVLPVLSGDSVNTQSRQEQAYYSSPLHDLRSPLRSAPYEEMGRQHPATFSPLSCEMTQPCQYKSSIHQEDALRVGSMTEALGKVTLVRYLEVDLGLQRRCSEGRTWVGSTGRTDKRRASSRWGVWQ